MSKLTVLIPAKNECDHIGACIRAIKCLAKAGIAPKPRNDVMKPRIHPADEPAIRKAFAEAVNMTADEIAAWLDTASSKAVGQLRRGESESIGRQSARRIIAILQTPTAALSESDYVHMRKVVGYVRRHGAQRPAGDVTHTRWRWSLMNWGHDPLR